MRKNKITIKDRKIRQVIRNNKEKGVKKNFSELLRRAVNQPIEKRT